MKINCNKNILPGTLPKVIVAQTGISFSNTQQPVSLWKWSFQTAHIISFPFPTPLWMEINSQLGKSTNKFKTMKCWWFTSATQTTERQEQVINSCFCDLSDIQNKKHVILESSNWHSVINSKLAITKQNYKYLAFLLHFAYQSSLP